MAKRAVFACSDPREFCLDAWAHAKGEFPDDKICPVFNFGSICDVVRYPGNLSEHPTIRFMVEHGIEMASAYNHENCSRYQSLIEGLDRFQELGFHITELNIFVKRVRAEAIPAFQAELYYQELDAAKEKVAVTHHVEEDSKAIAA